MAYSFLGGKFREIDTLTGLPLAGGQLYTYAAGTLNPLATYTDAGGLSANTNPVVLDSAGRADVFLGNAAYRMILKSPLGVTIWDEDNIPPQVFVQATTYNAFLASLAGSGGSALVGFLQGATGAVLRTLQSKELERVSLLDFGADPTGAADSTTALNAFVAYVSANTTRVRGIFPTGIYKYSTSPNFAIQNAEFVAEGEVHLRYTGAGNAVIFDAGSGAQNCNNVRFTGAFIIEALSTAGHGIYVRGLHRSRIEARVRGCGSASAGLRVEFSVCTDFRVRVTGPTEDSWYSASPPLNGYYITRRGVGEASSGCWFFPIVENVAGAGITLDYVTQCQFIGGTSEDGTGVGLVCTANSSRNAIYGMDIENNTSALTDAGQGNHFYSILAGSPGAAITITGTLSTHIGGFYDAIVDNGTGTVLESITYANNGGAISGTQVGQSKRSVLSNATGKFDQDRRSTDTFAAVSCPTGVATTVLTLPSTGNTFYQVGVYLPGVGAAASYGAVAVIYQDGATARIMSQTNGGALTLTLSGQNVQANQTSGVTQTLTAFSKPI